MSWKMKRIKIFSVRHKSKICSIVLTRQEISLARYWSYTSSSDSWGERGQKNYQRPDWASFWGKVPWIDYGHWILHPSWGAACPQRVNATSQERQQMIHTFCCGASPLQQTTAEFQTFLSIFIVFFVYHSTHYVSLSYLFILSPLDIERVSYISSSTEDYLHWKRAFEKAKKKKISGQTQILTVMLITDTSWSKSSQPLQERRKSFAFRAP